MSLQNHKDESALNAYGITAGDALAKNICVKCKQPALPKCHTEPGRREYLISALCEECFDAMFD